MTDKKDKEGKLLHNVIKSQPSNTGCKCMGFQIGRHSIFSASKATMTDKKDKEGKLLPDSERLTKFGKMMRAACTPPPSSCRKASS